MARRKSDKSVGRGAVDVLFPNITHPKKRAFLLAFSKSGVVTTAAEAAKIDRRTFYNWLDADPEFAEAVEQARDTAVDHLEQEAIKRAIKGSDTLLIFLLKGNRPDKYHDRVRAEVEHSGGINLEIAIPDALDGDDDE